MRNWHRITPYIVSALLVLLFWDVMRPLEKLGLLGNLHGLAPYVITLAVVLAVDFLPISWLWNGLIKLAVCFGCTVYMMGAPDVIEALHENAAAWLMGIPMPPLLEIRFWLTIFGWAVAVSLLRYVLIRGSLGGWLTVILCVYFVIFQLAAGLDTRAELMRAFLLGLLLTGVIRYPDQAQERHVPKPVRDSFFVWAGGLLLVSGIVFLVGWHLAKEHEVKAVDVEADVWPFAWSDFIPRQWSSPDSETEPGRLTMSALSGFSDDDSVLGRPLSLDGSLAFAAKSDAVTYWRGGAKVYYTGRGWEELQEPPVSIRADFRAELIGDENADSEALIDHADAAHSQEAEGQLASEALPAFDNVEVIRQRITMKNPNIESFIFHGGELIDFRGVTKTNETVAIDQLQYDPITGTYGAPVGIDGWAEYELSIVLHEGSGTARETRLPDLPEEWKHVYLQLPESLPKRVAELAEKAAGDAGTPYEQAVRIQNFLRENYAYHLSDIRLTPQGQDFVDHFLFEQKLGYCDHFSTAMAVMLRTLGIPTRWVKGFVPGQQGEDGVQTVLNLHAHSWVEAYIPDKGWVPFEPTPAYAASAGMNVQENAAHGQEQGGESWMERWNWNAITSRLDSAADAFPFGWNGIALTGASLLALAAAAVCVVRWIRKKKSFDLTSDLPEEQLMKMLEAGWRKLFRKFGCLRPGQTLRQYVESLPLKDKEEMKKAREFLAMYETLRYSDEAVYKDRGRSERIEIFRWLQKL